VPVGEAVRLTALNQGGHGSIARRRANKNPPQFGSEKGLIDFGGLLSFKRNLTRP